MSYGVTNRQFSIWSMVEQEGKSLRQVSRILHIGVSAVHKGYHAAANKIEGVHQNSPNIGDPSSRATRNPQSMADTVSVDRRIMAQTASPPGSEMTIYWQMAPYKLQEWRIDASLVPTICSYCNQHLHSHWQGNAAWCESCGRWFDGYGVGRMETW